MKTLMVGLLCIVLTYGPGASADLAELMNSQEYASDKAISHNIVTFGAPWL